MTATALCDALTEAGVSIQAQGRTRLVAHPRSAVDVMLMQLLRRFKVELLGAINRAGKHRESYVLGPCEGCDAEFVHAPDRFCPWCNVAAIGVLMRATVANDDTAEHDSALTPTVLTVPECGETTSQGQLGTVGQLHT
jgi:hypothetical protein